MAKIEEAATLSETEQNVETEMRTEDSGDKNDENDEDSIGETHDGPTLDTTEEVLEDAAPENEAENAKRIPEEVETDEQHTLEEIQSSVPDNQPTMQDHNDWVMKQKAEEQQRADEQQHNVDDLQQHIEEQQQTAEEQQNVDEQQHIDEQQLDGEQQQTADELQQQNVEQELTDEQQQTADELQQDTYEHQQENAYEKHVDEQQQLDYQEEELTTQKQVDEQMEQLHDYNPQLQESIQDEAQDHSHNLTEEAGLLPEWLLLLLHDSSVIDGDRLALVVIISITLLALHLINSFVTKSSRETPLIKRLADLDRKLFAATNELLIVKKEQAESKDTSMVDSGAGVEAQAMREVELQLQQTWAELESSRQTLRQEAERTNRIVTELEGSRREASLAQDEAKAAQEMVEELIASQGSKAGAGADQEKLITVVTELQSQLESQKVVLGKYEPRLKRKEKENKELTSQIKQLRADVANANLEKEKMKKDLTETMRSVEESASKLNEVFKNEEEWKSLSDLLQTQLDEKSVTVSEMEAEMSSLRSRISVFKNEAESKEEQLEVLQETLDELHNRSNKSNNGDNGWDVEEEENGWDVEDINDIKETAKLRVENKRNSEMKEALERELSELKTQLDTTESDMVKFKTEAVSLREARDEVVKDHTDLERRMEVLTEFFNKKEAELQRQLGLQSAKFGDVSTDAESSARQLVSVSSELDTTKEQVRGIIIIVKPESKFKVPSRVLRL